MKHLLKEFLRALGLGTLIFIVLLLVLYAQGKVEWTLPLFLQVLYSVLAYTMVLYLANTFVFLGMDRIFGKGRMTLLRIVTGFVSSLVVSILIIFLLRVIEEVVIEGISFRQFIEGEDLPDYYFVMIVTVIINILVHAFYFYKRYQENRVKEQKIIAGTASAKFESLKNQIDPHFLFNSLNVLSSLIEENPENAQRFTTSLSKVYRYVLEQRDKELVSVQEELDFAKTYMNLLGMRFENSLVYELPKVISNPEAKVVPLSLQLLLENTIKHNIVSPQKPLHIRIYEENGFLVVQNDLQKKEVLRDREGVGLQNIISRYAIITNRRVQTEQTDKHFTVKLPVLTKQVEIMERNFDAEENSFYKAQKKVEDIKGFYGNLIAYIVVIAALAVINLVTYPQYLWFFFPAAGWGIGVAIHGMSVFNYIPFLGDDWEDRKVRELMEKEKNKRWK